MIGCSGAMDATRQPVSANIKALDFKGLRRPQVMALIRLFCSAARAVVFLSKRGAETGGRSLRPPRRSALKAPPSPRRHE